MSEATENRGLTLRQQRVAEVIASGTAETIRDAGRKAGVHEVSVHRALGNAKVQREIERQRAIQADKAKDLKHLASRKLAARLASDEASDALVLGTYKTANEVLASGVEEDAEPQATAADYDRARAKLMQAVKIGMYLQRRLNRNAPPQR